MGLIKKLKQNGRSLTHDDLYEAFMNQEITGSDYGKGIRKIDGDPILDMMKGDALRLIGAIEEIGIGFYNRIKVI